MIVSFKIECFFILLISSSSFHLAALGSTETTPQRFDSCQGSTFRRLNRILSKKKDRISSLQRIRNIFLKMKYCLQIRKKVEALRNHLQPKVPPVLLMRINH